ncbi:MAG: ribonuclease III [Patescibacteria group bacterium]
MPDLSDLEKQINVIFKNKDLLQNAFVHRSYLNENKSFKLPSNEKLEFLGDSVLSLATSVYLYKKYPLLQEGDYTEIKSAVVKTSSLAEAAESLGLGDYFLLSRGEDQGGGRVNKNILADCFEALIAVIFIDQGFKKAYDFILTYLFGDKLDMLVTNKEYVSSKSALQERFQSRYKVIPEYKVLEEEGPEHKRTFTVGVYLKDKKLSEGVGASKKEAEEQAAALALSALK